MASAVLPFSELLPLYRVDPLSDVRWTQLVERHPQVSVFHSVPWLAALQHTYGFEPVVFTTAPPDAPLNNGIACCYVRSWITGKRLVSLPFSDHCEPLSDSAADLSALIAMLARQIHPEGLKYVEVRTRLPLHGANSTQAYCFHEIDLRPGPDTLFANFHKSSTQRKVQRADREGLTYECGRSPALLNAFCDLLLLTRRRHGVPPQPRAWFQSLIDCFGEALQIRVAFHGEQPAAAILTIRHRDTLVYKYGCSDTSLNQLGGTQLLFWRSIQEAALAGLQVFDLGRSDSDNPGLITFKDRLGATRSTLTYSRFTSSPHSDAFGPAGTGWAGRLAGSLAPRLPGSVLRLAGSLLYKHIA